MKKTEFIQHFFAVVSRILASIFLGPQIAGTGNLEKALEMAKKENKSLVIVSNHLSDLDPFFIFGLMPLEIRKNLFPIILLGKISLFDRWWKKMIMNSMGCISVGNDILKEGMRAHLLKVIRKIRGGKNIFFFPEGRVCPDGELGKDLGVVTLLTKFDSFVLLPIRIAGIKNFRPNYLRILLQDGKLSIAFGEPLLIQRGSQEDAVEIIKSIDINQCHDAETVSGFN